MNKMEISDAAVKRNVTWIEAVEEALADCGNTPLTKGVLKAAGQKCAQQILADCEEILGKKPETVDELLDATNQRRLQRHNLASLWEKQDDKAHLKIDECACTLVRAGLAKPNPVHCLCTVGMFENIFSAVCRGPVNVEVVKTIGNGDDACEFYVNFVE
ncbi:MAG: hypothetical protein HQ551_01730 [Desulfobacteraceae bacterium]|nr:hypothetical protein [Desulfobacteraceae bacterium]